MPASRSPDGEGDFCMTKMRTGRRILSFLMAAVVLWALLPATPAAAVGSLSAVYLDGISGNDSGDGASADTAVKTFEAAKELLAKDGTIYVTGTVTVSGASTWSLPTETYGEAKVQFAQVSTSNVSCVSVPAGAALTLQDIVIDGGRAADPDRVSPGTLILVNGSLTMKDGTVLQNNYTGNVGGAVFVVSAGSMTMEGGTIRDNTSYGTSTNPATKRSGAIATAKAENLTIQSGEITGNYSADPNNTEGFESAIYVQAIAGNIALSPTSDISITGRISSVKDSCNLVITPDDAYPVTVKTNAGSVVPDSGTYTIPIPIYTATAGFLISLGVTLKKEAPTAATYTSGDLTINGAAGYGGSITVDGSGKFTMTATEEHYVLDTVYVDGVAVTDDAIRGASGYDYAFNSGITEGTHSIVATFAHTINFSDPYHGTLSVRRDGTPLTSGDIVFDGQVLTITASPDANYALTDLSLTGLTDNGDGTYTVSAKRGDPTPSVSAAFALASFTITVADTLTGGEIAVSESGGRFAAGQTVTVTATPDENYVLESLTYTAGGKIFDVAVVDKTGSFIMPAADVTLGAVFTDHFVEIDSVEELMALAAAVKAGDDCAGKTVMLTADLDLRGKEFVPIGFFDETRDSAAQKHYPFRGSFDGGGHTVTLAIDSPLDGHQALSSALWKGAR